MRLIALELHGFKSFPDRTRLEFNKGITAVVGPNGSGKSNIADAVRWALGEQSTKTLRGSLMEDVIFNGTQERKPMGFAMVRLVLDNKRGHMEGYGEEVTVSRRLYRSGESAYSINGEQVRMRDVHELFMDTGLGRDGYSIIGQGKISEIVSAKSSERREIFEEAAGIAKFRYRRTDAERRLAGAEENLVRLLDILGELEERVGPLKEQSEKAKKFLTLAEERKQLEIALWVHQLRELRTKLSEQEQKILVSKNDYEKLEHESENVQTKLEETHERMTELSAAAEERRRLIRGLEQQAADEKAQIAVLENDLHHNQKSLARIVSELSGAEEQTKKIEAALKEKQDMVAAAKQQYLEDKEKLEALKESYSKVQTELSELEGEIKGTEEEKEALEQRISQMAVEEATRSTQKSESGSRLQELLENVLAHKNSVQEHKENVAECKLQVLEIQEKLEKETKKLNAIEGKYGEKLSQQEALQADYQKLADQIHEKRSRVKLLQDLEANMEGFAGSVRYVMRQQTQGKISGVYGTVSSIIETDAMYTTAIETALGGAMQNLVVEHEQAAKAGMQALKIARAGRATFLPLTSVRGRHYDFSSAAGYTGFVGSGASLVRTEAKFQPVIDWLLARVCIVDTLDHATEIAKAHRYRFRIVTLDGQVINAGGSFTGGSTVRSAGVLGRKVEIEELIKEGKLLRAKATNQEPILEKTADELKVLLDEKGQKQEKLQSIADEKTRLTLTLEQLKRSHEQAEKVSSLAQNELRMMEERLSALEQGESDFSLQTSKAKKELSLIKEKKAERIKKQQELAFTLEDLRQTVSEQTMKVFEHETKLETLSAEVEREKAGIALAKTGHQQLQEEQATLLGANRDIGHKKEELLQSSQNIEKEVKINNQSIEEFLAQRTALEKSTTELSRKERAFATEREKVTRELVRLEERAHAVQGKYDGIIRNLWDEYELTRSRATQEAKVLTDPEVSQRRLDELRGAIRKLGSVNVEAIEEYKEVSERYEFLSKQLKDVEESKGKLEQLIVELTEEMQELFLDTFEKINHEFSITFRELFGGGKAQLLLTEHEDPLEAGIEIHVQPPGKVIKNLSLLSGGEQSFVAIAIYFAILKVKPAPFVLLDEIEAALDDVNVVRYASYLRVMSKNTQCISITHRRGTMEEADMLYGVTMQEEGVSKLLELDVHEVESKLGMEATD